MNIKHYNHQRRKVQNAVIKPFSIFCTVIFKVDVIVNTVSSSVQLRQGGVSTAIISAAGQSLQSECDRVMRQKQLTRLSPGEFIKTRAGNLTCKTVYHSVCDSYNGPRSEQVREYQFDMFSKKTH